MRVTVARWRARVLLRTIDNGRDRDRGNFFVRSASRPGRGESNALNRHDKCDKAEQDRADASVATLARLDGTRPKIWNDFYRVREACQEAERRFGLRATARADRTAARRPTRAETEQAARRGWKEPPRVTLRREVCTAAAGGGRSRSSSPAWSRPGSWCASGTAPPTRVRSPGTRSGWRATPARDGGVIWYGGGKLAADLTLPKLRARWAGQAGGSSRAGDSGLVARAVLRGRLPRRRHMRGTRPGSSPICASRGCWSGAVQRDRSGPGHRLRRHAPRSHRPKTGRRGGTAAGGWPPGSPCRSCAATGTETRAVHRERSADVPVHRPGTGRALPARVPPGRGGRGTHPPLRLPTRPAADAAWAAADTLRCRGTGAAQPGLCGARPTPTTAPPARHMDGPRRSRGTATVCAPPRGSWPLAGDLSGGAQSWPCGADSEPGRAHRRRRPSCARPRNTPPKPRRPGRQPQHMHAAMTRATSAFRPGPAERLKRARAAAAGDPIRRDFPVPLPLGQSLASAAVGDLGGRPHVGRQPPERAGPGR